MPKHTRADAPTQDSGLGAWVTHAVRRHLIGLVVGSSLAAALVAPTVSLAASSQVRIAPHMAGQSQLIADGPTIWCGGIPLPC